MGKKRDARLAVEEFCNTWFALREPEKAAEFLDSDIRFEEAGKREHAHGKQEVLDYIRRDIENIKAVFYPEVSVIYEQSLGHGICSLSCRLDLRNETYTWQMEGHFTLALDQE